MKAKPWRKLTMRTRESIVIDAVKAFVLQFEGELDLMPDTVREIVMTTLRKRHDEWLRRKYPNKINREAA